MGMTRRNVIKKLGIGVGVLAAVAAGAAEAGVVVQGEAVSPVAVTTNAAGHVVFDFGQHEFGWVEVDAPCGGDYDLIWGELVDAGGAVVTNEYFTKKAARVRCAHTIGTLAGGGWTRIPYEEGNDSVFNKKEEEGFGRIMPFRWLEVVKAPFEPTAARFHQVPVYYPYDMAESAFECDSKALERVYEFCKHTVRSTTFMGVFIDGDRERRPYEADAFITQLSTYAMSADDTLVRRSIEYLSVKATWPTEWKQFFIRMVYEDWMHSGKTDLIRRYWPLMRDIKAWRFLRRADGLVITPGEWRTPSPDGRKFSDIADWAKCYRDGFVFTPANVIVNALHIRNLRDLEEMARSIGEEADAAMFADEAAATREAFQRVFFDPVERRYRDGEGTDHATVQGNAMALACGAVPPECVMDVADYVATKGFSCSTYMAQFVLEALYAAGRADDAFRLMTSDGERGWLAMMAKGATITMEFWDLTLEEPGRIPDMNHSWSTAPLNITTRYVLGVTPAKPGWEEISFKPQFGPLNRVRAVVPTPKGAFRVEATREGDSWCVELVSPAPVRAKGSVLPAGRHVLVF